MEFVNSRKGMSQILTLIVAASVLMMTALTLVFMAQGGLGDAFSGSNRQSCISTVDTRCATTGGTFATPESCQTADLNSAGAFSNVDSYSNSEITCSSSSGGGTTPGGDDGGGGGAECAPGPGGC